MFYLFFFWNVFLHLWRALRHIRQLLTVAAAKLIATSIVGARLDYCNSLLYRFVRHIGMQLG